MNGPRRAKPSQAFGRRRAARGFTLLELLIAISIFALLGLGTYRMLDSVLRSDEATRKQEQALRELTRAIWSLERDLLQVTARPIRDNFADPRAAFLGESQAQDGSAAFELTRSGWRNPTGVARSQLQRVRWRLAGETLERVYWVVLDRAVDSEPRVQQVLTEVEALTVRYLDSEGNWQNDWPSAQNEQGGGAANDEKATLPQALELTLEHKRYGKVIRLLRLPDGPAKQTPGQGGAGGGSPEQPAEPTPESNA